MHRSANVAAGSPGRWVRPGYDADVSVITVNYNGRALLERTLDTIFGSYPRSTLEVIVVDNASRDGSLEMLRSKYPQVRCITNRSNVGLARANNQGMELATGRYLFLLNNDTIVQLGAIDALVDYLDAHPEVGTAGSKVLNVDGSIQGTVKNHPTPMAAIFGRESLPTRLFPNNRFSRKYLVYQTQDFGRPFAAGSVSCCAQLIRREAIERAGPMDDGYFVYWCDVDWCRAIWRAGYEVHCVPDSVVVHDEHQGARAVRRPRSWRMIADFHRGAYRYYRKWHIAHAWEPMNVVAVSGLAIRALLVAGSQHLAWRIRAMSAGERGQR